MLLAPSNSTTSNDCGPVVVVVVPLEPLVPLVEAEPALFLAARAVLVEELLGLSTRKFTVPLLVAVVEVEEAVPRSSVSSEVPSACGVTVAITPGT